MATPPLEKVRPARGPLPPEVFVTFEGLPPPTCDATPRGCADCHVWVFLRDLSAPLPDRELRTP